MKHVTADLFAQWLEGDLETRKLFWLMLRHLYSVCSECAVNYDEAATGRIPGTGLLKDFNLEERENGADTRAALKKAISRVQKLKADAELLNEHGEGEALLAELLGFPEEKRQGVLRRTRKKYVSLPLCSLLLKRSRTEAPRDGYRSRHLAVLAEAVAKKATGKAPWRVVAQDHLALALGLQGNASRVLGQFSEAKLLLRQAHELSDAGSGDPILFADLLSLEASLFRDLQQLERAEKLVRRALQLYQSLGEKHLYGRALMKLAVVLACGDKPAEAVERLCEAKEVLDFQKEPHLEAMLFENLALNVSEAGDPMQGLEILRAHPVKLEASRKSRLHHEWTTARILTQLGEVGGATATMESVCEGFAEIQDPLNTALSAMDLAILYTKLGVFGEVKRLALEIMPAFQAMAVPERIWASLLLFQQAAEAEKITVGLLEQVRSVVKDRRGWVLPSVVN